MQVVPLASPLAAVCATQSVIHRKAADAPAHQCLKCDVRCACVLSASNAAALLHVIVELVKRSHILIRQNPARDIEVSADALWIGAFRNAHAAQLNTPADQDLSGGLMMLLRKFCHCRVIE